jgi:regulator of protease activity HflC (stomatin/prohibitin superfamily)
MAQLKSYGVLRQLRSEASAYIVRYKNGRKTKAGRGLAFWFSADGGSVVEVPMDDRDLPFLFNSRSKDFQEITVQGMIVWRVADPEKLADRIDFSIDLGKGFHVGQPVDQIATLLTGLAQQLSAGYLAGLEVGPLLAGGVQPLTERMEAGLVGDARLAGMGIEVANVRVADVSPSADLKRALQTPTFERLQQQADEATFERRALAVEKERAIAENELANKIELARRQKELIEREDENARNQAIADAAAKKIENDAGAERIRTEGQAQIDMEQARMQIYSALPPGVMMGLAAREFAAKLQSIEHLNVTPDMISTLLGDALTRIGRAPPA